MTLCFAGENDKKHQVQLQDEMSLLNVSFECLFVFACGRDQFNGIIIVFMFSSFCLYSLRL